MSFFSFFLSFSSFSLSSFYSSLSILLFTTYYYYYYYLQLRQKQFFGFIPSSKWLSLLHDFVVVFFGHLSLHTFFCSSSPIFLPIFRLFSSLGFWKLPKQPQNRLLSIGSSLLVASPDVAEYERLRSRLNESQTQTRLLQSMVNIRDQELDRARKVSLVPTKQTKKRQIENKKKHVGNDRKLSVSEYQHLMRFLCYLKANQAECYVHPENVVPILS